MVVALVQDAGAMSKSTQEVEQPIVPNPGSDAALDMGCTCPVLDNAHGRGVETPYGIAFWHTADCKVHSPSIRQSMEER